MPEGLTIHLNHFTACLVFVTGGAFEMRLAETKLLFVYDATGDRLREKQKKIQSPILACWGRQGSTEANMS